MNENKDYSRVTPYKATVNLNTAIGNPSVNINDTMDMNIQTMATNAKPNVASIPSVVQTPPVTPVPTVTSNQPQQNIEQKQISNITNNVQNSNQGTIPIVNTITNNNVTSGIDTKTNVEPPQNSDYVTKTYVNVNNEPKKKSVTFKVTSELKMALLIIVILLVFIFLLPIISEILGGY